MWTLLVSGEVSTGSWDTLILSLWIVWPLFLCSVLAYAKHRGQQLAFWRLSNFSDFLLLGAYVPLVLGVIYYNIQLPAKLLEANKPYEENLLFVGYYSVKLWLATAISVFLFYVASKIFLKNKKASISD
jgi:heme exporter protein D